MENNKDYKCFTIAQAINRYSCTKVRVCVLNSEGEKLQALDHSPLNRGSSGGNILT